MNANNATETPNAENAPQDAVLSGAEGGYTAHGGIRVVDCGVAEDGRREYRVIYRRSLEPLQEAMQIVMVEDVREREVLIGAAKADLLANAFAG